MAMRFQILGSSSSGNSALLITEYCKILIDAGFSARRLSAFLEACGESIDAIDAVFLTHEHGDHTSGINGLSRLPHLKVFANHDTANAVQASLKRRPSWQLFETGSTFRFRDLEITSFPIPHDACDPVGFVFSQSGEDLFCPKRSIAWCIDLGYVPHLVRERVRGADILVLEANHETQLLDEDPQRPWSVKQRIKSRHGHLSNVAASEFIVSVEEPHWQQIYLAHLSKDCNKVSLVEGMFHPTPPITRQKNYAITIVDPFKHTLPPYDL